MPKGGKHGWFCTCKKCTGQSVKTPKPVSLGGSTRIGDSNTKNSKKFKDRKEHDTKGRDTHARRGR